MTPKPEDVLVKGTAILGLCHFLEKEISAEARAGCYQGLPEPYSQRFQSASILASDRVPLSVANLLVTQAARAKGEPVESFAQRAGTFSAKEGTSAVFKSFFCVLSVANALEIAPMMWSRVYSCGKMRADAEGKHATIRVTDFPGDPAACARIAGWLLHIGTLSGAVNLRIRRDRCTSKGDPECTWEVDWE